MIRVTPTDERCRAGSVCPSTSRKNGSSSTVPAPSTARASQMVRPSRYSFQASVNVTGAAPFAELIADGSLLRLAGHQGAVDLLQVQRPLLEVGDAGAQAQGLD